LKEESLDQRNLKSDVSKCKVRVFNHQSNVDLSCAAADQNIMRKKHINRQSQRVESTDNSVHGTTCLGSEIEPQSLDEEFTNAIFSNNLVSHRKKRSMWFRSHNAARL
jgi:hypothetical protein